MINSSDALINILAKMPFNTKIIREISIDGKIDEFLKVKLSIENLYCSNWFHFEKEDMLLAESNSNQIVILKGNEYLKIYTVFLNASNNCKKFINITKGNYINGLFFYEKKKYPRPIFYPSMYKVGFAPLNQIRKELSQEIIKIDENIKLSMIEISFYTIKQNLIAQIYLIN